NIAYSLQLTDFNNYIITRMGLFGSVLAMMHKQATINFVSIIEGLIKSYLATIWGKCKNCPRNETCSRKIIRKHKEGIFKNIIRVYKEYELLDLDDEIYDRILTLYRYRNSIHLTKLRSDDEEDLEDSISTHNEAVEKLKLIDDSMKSNIGFWYYGANCSGSKP
ncbi:MAG: hypothetical protein K6A90_07100, partial [Lachnospiraceae bacterium]|nr:hypothetical protein [Lachnospiraceae bacterium]